MDEDLPKSPVPNNEQEYIEMSNHLKKLYEEMELKNNKLKQGLVF